MQTSRQTCDSGLSFYGEKLIALALESHDPRRIGADCHSGPALDERVGRYVRFESKADIEARLSDACPITDIRIASDYTLGAPAAAAFATFAAIRGASSLLIGFQLWHHLQ